MTTEAAPIATGEPIVLQERERRTHATILIDAFTQALRSQPEFVTAWLDRFHEVQSLGSSLITQSVTFQKDGITYHVAHHAIQNGQKGLHLTAETSRQDKAVLKQELTLETGKVHWQGDRAVRRSTISYRDNSDHYITAALRSFQGLKPIGENTQFAVQKAEEMLATLTSSQTA